MNSINRQLRIYTYLILLSLTLVSCSTDITRKKIINTDPKNNTSKTVSNEIKYMFEQSLTYMEQKNYDEAIKILETLLSKEKRLTAPFVNLGIAYNRTGKQKYAERNLITALRLDISNAVANNELGLLYRKTGRFEAAKATYLNALTMHPDYLPVRKNLGILCEIYLHDLPCAIEQYQAYLQYKADDKTVSIWVQELKQRIALKQSAQQR